MSDTEKPQIYQFGEFRLDLAEEFLYQNGEKVAINRKTFQVLKLLVERAGEIVGKNEFFETVWADAFVEDNVLTVTMTALRKALGDNPKEPKFIENLPRKGYRFIAAVEVFEKPPEIKLLKIEYPTASVSIEDSAADAKNENSDDETAASFQSLPMNNRQPPSKIRRLFPIGVFGVCLLVLFFVGAFNYFNSKFRKNARNAAPQIESIAVLPFVNPNAETAYLSDGLTDSIIGDLSALQNLRVVSRDSAYQYKDKAADLAEIGRALNVQAILTGEFAKRGDDLMVNVALVDLPNNHRLWEHQYVRPETAALDLQKEIARDVADRLRSTLTDAERQNLSKRGTDDDEAFKLYLKGRYEWNRRTLDGFPKALDYFNQAVEKDATFALAYDGAAKCYLMVQFDYLKTSQKRAAFVKEAAHKALEIDPNLGAAYATLAINSYYSEWNWERAEQEFKRAIELEPNSATAHHWYAEFLATEGRFDESFAEYERALELDPLSLAIQTDIGLNYYYAHQPDHAIEYLLKLKELNPDYARIYIFLSQIYERKEMYQESI